MQRWIIKKNELIFVAIVALKENKKKRIQRKVKGREGQNERRWFIFGGGGFVVVLFVWMNLVFVLFQNCLPAVTPRKFTACRRFGSSGGVNVGAGWWSSERLHNRFHLTHSEQMNSRYFCCCCCFGCFAN